jgi:RNA polymerase sigma factor (sigma-70 family)
MDTGHGGGNIAFAQANAEESARLAAAIASGDREAEREFALRYLPRVRAMLLERSRNPDWTADLQQDVMVEAICALRRGRLQDPTRLSAFVMGIARNLLNNHLRTMRRVEPLELPDDLPDLRGSAERRDEHQWEERALRAIETLDEVDRAILQMTLVDGLKPGAIAERLRLSSDVVRQRKLRATRRVMEIVRAPSQNEPSGHIPSGEQNDPL